MTAMAQQMRPSAYDATAHPDGPTYRIFYKPLVAGDTYDEQDKGECMRPKVAPAPPFYYAEERLRYHVPTTKEIIRCHAIICFAAHGPPSEGDEVMHKMGECRFDDCLNPLHLRWGSKLENRKDHLLGPKRLGRRKRNKAKPGAKHSKGGTARVTAEYEARRIDASTTGKVTRSAAVTMQGVITRSKAKAE